MLSLPRSTRLIIGVLVAILAIGFLFGVYRALTGKPKAEAKLARNQTEAAIGSGKDAVATVGARGAAESDLDRKVSNAQAKVAAAPDAVAADSAGRLGLCALNRAFCEHPVLDPDS